MANIAEIRQKYPQYSDLTDKQLAEGLYKKHYRDMSFDDFSKRIGLNTQPEGAIGATGTQQDWSGAKQVLPPTTSLGRTMLEQGLQGATLGFADEAMDRLGAGIASLATGENYGDLLDEARGMSQTRMQKQMEERPVTSIASNIGGALLTGGALGSTKSGANVLARLGTGGTGARIAKGAASGATTGAAYGFGAGQGDINSRLESAGEGALYGGAIGGAIPAAGAMVRGAVGGTRNAMRGMGSRSGDALDESLAVIKERSSQAYNRMRDLGATINRNRGISIANKTDDAIRASGKLNKGLHGQTMSVLSDLKSRAKQGDLTIEELDQYRQLFKDVIDNNTEIGGRMKPDAFKAAEAIRSIDDQVRKLTGIDIKGGSTEALDALNIARSEWARKSKFETIANIIKKSEGDPNYVKRELTKIVNNGKKSRGFTKDELSALKEAAKLSPSEAVLKIVGKFGFDPSRLGSGVGALAGGGFGTAIGGTGLGATIPAVGTASKYGLKLSTRGKAENLLRTIEGNAPKNANIPSAPSGLPALTGAGAGQSVESPTRITVTPKDIPQNTLETQFTPMNAIGSEVIDYPNPSPEILSGQMDYEPLLQEPTYTAPQQTLPQYIRQNEGFSPVVYKDTVGKRTIGNGFNMESGIAKQVWKKAGINKKFEDVFNGKAAISPMESDALANASYEIAYNDAVSLFPALGKMSPQRQEALLDMSYQMGKSTLLDFKNMRNAINNGKWTQAAKHLLQSEYAKQTPGRAKANARKFIGG